jgi:hypothetical protein
MKLIVGLAREIGGLFVDDGALALCILAVVGVSGVLAKIGAPPLLTGATLLIGCVVLLTESVRRASRR